MRRKWGFLGLWNVLLLCLLPVSVHAQYTSQQISGFVKDPTGAVVPGATITIKQIGTQMERTSTSSDTGYYIISNIPIGEYEVAVEAPGFKRFVQRGVVVTVNSKPTVDATLEVGVPQEIVTVTAGTATIESSTGEVGRLITADQATKLLLNGRNFSQLLSLMPGVSTSNRSPMDLFGGYGSNQGVIMVNGGRRGAQAWNVDGSDNKDNGGSGNNFVAVNPDALAEFKVLTTNYSAEYGQSSGAVVNMALKSGTQNFHGAAYEYVRNNAFDARAFGAATTPKLTYNNFGANLGGPIYIPGKFNADKTKLFFFFSTDQRRLRQGNPAFRTVPTVAMRDGDFSALAAASWPKDPLTGVAFPNGKIPSTRFSPNAKKLLDNYSAPNYAGPGGNYVYSPPNPLNCNEYIIKVDYNLSSRHQFAAHWAHDYYTSLQNTGNLMTYDRNIPGTNASIKWTFIASPTLVNTFQVTGSGNVIAQINFKPNPLLVKDTTRAGNGIAYPTLFGASTMIPGVNVSGYSSLGVRPLEWQNFNRVFQFKDDLSKIIGSHNLKLGALIMRSRKNQDNQPNVNGVFSFDTSIPATLNTGNALANALLGNFTTYNEGGRGREGWFRFTQVEFYGADNWKVSRHISLDFGLRFQLMGPQYAALNNASVFVPPLYDPAKAPRVDPSSGLIASAAGTYDPINGLAVGGSSYPEAYLKRFPDAAKSPYKDLFRGLPEHLLKYGRVLAPRFSLAWDVFGNQSTVLRGGFGMTYERIQGNYIFSGVNNPPFVQDQTIYYGNVENPAGGSLRPAPLNVGASGGGDYDIEMKIPTVQNWSFGLQRKITKNATLDLAYVGSNAYHQTRLLRLNQLRVGTRQARPGINVNALKPYLGYGDIWHLDTGATFNYHSLQSQFRMNFSRSGFLNVAYTWSKNISDVTEWNGYPIDSYNPRLDRCLADYDRPHMLVVSYIYPVPFLRDNKAWYGKAFGGWQLSGVTTIQSGRPVNITVSGDPAGIGYSGSQRPNATGNWKLDPGARTTTKWFETSVFTVPANGTWGSLARNAMRGPGINNWDVALQKSFPIGEKVKFEYRLEVFNALNHLSYWSVGSNVGDANFGQVTGALDPRILQMALRLDF